MQEITTEASLKKGYFYYSLTAATRAEDEPGSSLRKTANFENSEFTVLGMSEVKVSKDGSYPLVGVKLINHQDNQSGRLSKGAS